MSTQTEGTGAEQVRRDDEPWCDELVRLSDDWMLATVTTPFGKRIKYRLMVRNHA